MFACTSSSNGGNSQCSFAPRAFKRPLTAYNSRDVAPVSIMINDTDTVYPGNSVPLLAGSVSINAKETVSFNSINPVTTVSITDFSASIHHASEPGAVAVNRVDIILSNLPVNIQPASAVIAGTALVWTLNGTAVLVALTLPPLTIGNTIVLHFDTVNQTLNSNDELVIAGAIVVTFNRIL